MAGTFPPFLSLTVSFALRTRWTSRSRSSRVLRSRTESLPPALSWRALRSSIWRWRRSGLRWARRSVLWAATAAFPIGSMVKQLVLIETRKGFCRIKEMILPFLRAFCFSAFRWAAAGLMDLSRSLGIVMVGSWIYNVEIILRRPRSWLDASSCR